MSATQILSQERIAEMAEMFGFEPHDPYVVENAEDAIKRHGQPSAGYNGDARLYWHVNPRTRLIDAEMLLEGHLREEARVRGADCGSIERLHRDAYGED